MSGPLPGPTSCPHGRRAAQLLRPGSGRHIHPSIYEPEAKPKPKICSVYLKYIHIHVQSLGQSFQSEIPDPCRRPVCLECFFDQLSSAATPEAEKAAAVNELAAAVLCPEARAQRFAGRLIWRTPFLLQAVGVLGSGALAPRDQEGRDPPCVQPLLDFAAACILEEVEGAAPDLAEALVALVASSTLAAAGEGMEDRPPGGPPQGGRRRLPLRLLAQVLDSAGPDAADALLQRVEASGPVLAALGLEASEASCAGATDGAGTAACQAALSVMLRLAERGSPRLGPHLGRAGPRLAWLLQASAPGAGGGDEESAPVAAGLLALFSLCSLHPELLQLLLGRDPEARLRCVAEGLRRHLAAPEGALRAAAAGLVDELAQAAPAEATLAWLGTGFLSEWLVETCRDPTDLRARTAAARALGHLAGDAQLLRRLQGFACDALLGACTDAVTAAMCGSLGARRDLLGAALGSLSRLLAASCPPPLAPQRLLGLLGAACVAECASGAQHGTGPPPSRSALPLSSSVCFCFVGGRKREATHGL